LREVLPAKNDTPYVFHTLPPLRLAYSSD